MNFGKFTKGGRANKQGKKPTLTFIDVDRLLQAADIIRRREGDQLICAGCAAKLRGVSIKTVQVAIRRGTLTTYTLCCGTGPGRTFVDKAEVLALPKASTKRNIHVGVKRLRKRGPINVEHDEHDALPV